MATIHDLIAEAAVEFETATGKKPHNVYLGEVEIAALKRWAYDNNYIAAIDVDLRWGSRPEVNRLFVYAVNEVTHIACA